MRTRKPRIKENETRGLKQVWVSNLNLFVKIGTRKQDFGIWNELAFLRTIDVETMDIMLGNYTYSTEQISFQCYWNFYLTYTFLYR